MSGRELALILGGAFLGACLALAVALSFGGAWS
jgi:hypothetical protein